MSDMQKPENNGPMAVLACAVVGCATYSKYESAIRWWIHENLMLLLLAAFALTAAAVLLVLRRIRKKDEEHFTRARALRGVKPTRNQMDYYKRRN